MSFCEVVNGGSLNAVVSFLSRRLKKAEVLTEPPDPNRLTYAHVLKGDNLKPHSVMAV
jgi:hypothetical protein